MITRLINYSEYTLIYLNLSTIIKQDKNNTQKTTQHFKVLSKKHLLGMRTEKKMAVNCFLLNHYLLFKNL